MLTILVFEIKDGKNAQKVKKNINCNLSLYLLKGYKTQKKGYKTQRDIKPKKKGYKTQKNAQKVKKINHHLLLLIRGGSSNK